MITKDFTDELVYQYGHLRLKMPALLRRPLGYFLYITGECNLDCVYCWQRHQEDTESVDGWTNTTWKSMAPEEWVKVVDNIPRGSFLGISGGEATISPALASVVKVASGRLPMSINTNLLSIKDEQFAILTSPGVQNISVSIDGFAEVHDVSRNRKGSFDKIVGNIERINSIKGRRKKPRITIKTVLMNENVDRLPEFMEFCENELKAGALNVSFEKTDQYYQFSLLHHPDARKIFAESRPKLYPYEDTGKVVRVLSELLESSSKSRCKFVIYPRMKNKEQIERFIREKAKNVYAPCYIPRSLITVLPDGQVIPCLSLGLGNVRDHGYDIRDVLKNDRYKGFLDIISSSTELPAACNVCCFAKVRG